MVRNDTRIAPDLPRSRLRANSLASACSRDSKSYPSVPYIVNLLMDPLEKVTPDAPGYGYIVRGRLPSRFAYFALSQRSTSRTSSAATPRSRPLSTKYSERQYGTATRMIRRSSILSKSPVHGFAVTFRCRVYLSFAPGVGLPA